MRLNMQWCSPLLWFACQVQPVFLLFAEWSWADCAEANANPKPGHQNNSVQATETSLLIQTKKNPFELIILRNYRRENSTKAVEKGQGRTQTQHNA